MKNGMHEDEYGTKSWFKDDQKHREDGPAVIFADGTKFWWLNGKCHRVDGPAIITANGTKLWYKNGKCHREDGPAIESPYGYKEWYLNNMRYSSFDDWLEKLNIPDEDTLFLKLKWV